jgi:hypothetical protein
MAGRTVDLAFRADLSNLVQQLKKMPGTTEAEAKKMAASLERQIKKAEKASVKAAKASSKAWKAQRKATRNAGQSFDDVAERLKGVEHAGGETSSIMGGVASAMDMVSPAAGGAARGLGDLAGGIEMVSRAGSGLAGPLAVLTVAVTVGTKVWAHYAEKQQEVQKELEQTKKRRIELAQVMATLDDQLIEAEIEAGVARGDATERDLMAFRTSINVRKKFSTELEALQKEATEASKIHKDALKAEADARASLNTNSHASVVAYGAANRATHAAANASAQADNALNALKKTESDYTNRLIAAKEARMDALEALKKSTSGGRKAKTVLQQLREETEKLLPKEQLDKVSELSIHLERLKAAASGSKKAATALAGSITAVSTAIEGIKAKEAAEEIADLVEESRKLVPPEPISRLDQLITMHGRLGEAIEETGDKDGEIAAARTQIHAEILNEIDEELRRTKEAADEKAKAEKEAAREMALAYMDAYNSINQAASMVAAEVLSRAEQAASDEIAIREEAADDARSLLEEEVATRDELRERAKTEDVARELAASEAAVSRLKVQAEAEEAALAKSQEMQGQAIRRAFTAQQALRISEIIMSTAAAMMNAAATTPPVALPFVLGGISALGATQVALVGAQEPPSFHLGGIVGARPDERTITARAGEGVLTRQGVSAIGGEEGLAAANRGQGGGPLVVQMVYRHKVLDEVLTDSVRRGGPIGSAINRRNPKGRRNPHGRRAS